VLCQDYVNGGLQAPNVDTFCKSTSLAWISRLLTTDQNTTETWKSIPNYFFERHGSLHFLLRCNYDNKFLEKLQLPTFYRTILNNFLELKTLYKCHNDSDLFLFSNKDILIDGKPFFL
jgi:hypothetical protein